MDVIGVVGAGTMGKGIALALLLSGFGVTVIENNEIQRMEFVQQIEKEYRILSMFHADQYLGWNQIENKIKISEELDLIKSCSIIIESINEDINSKKKLFERLDQIVDKQCIFLSNTSCISITRLASYTQRPEKVIGTHFMNPVNQIHSVEVIKGIHTSVETIESTKRLLEGMGKQAILINDMAGFVSNRISHLMINEAAFILQDRIADVVTIDEIFKKCYGHKMGPLETADLIGIDTVVDSLNILYQFYQDSKFRCCPLLKQMVASGYCGKKTKKGFYTY